MLNEEHCAQLIGEYIVDCVTTSGDGTVSKLDSVFKILQTSRWEQNPELEESFTLLTKWNSHVDQLAIPVYILITRQLIKKQVLILYVLNFASSELKCQFWN